MSYGGDSAVLLNAREGCLELRPKSFGSSLMAFSRSFAARQSR
jgi:hypothetical protein